MQFRFGTKAPATVVLYRRVLSRNSLGPVVTRQPNASESSIELVARAMRFGSYTAIVDRSGRFNYEALLQASSRVASALLHGSADVLESRVAFLVSPGFEYVATQWGIWRAGGVAVPLAVMHPPAELEYAIDDSMPAVIVADRQFESIVRPLAKQRGLRFVLSDEIMTCESTELPRVAPSRRAMILYTSGTTSRAKGVVTTHENIAAQIKSLVKAWQWTEDDHILHCLPLHHIHGIVNCLSCALWSGATCEMLPKFEADEVWQRIQDSRRMTLFMAVPTIYTKLITAWSKAPPQEQQTMSGGCRRLRLMVSGSAALPISTLKQWEQISGHTLLERYGMTEIGMALSNPLVGERLAGHVGSPLTAVHVRLVDEQGNEPETDAPAEIQVQGPTVFLEYWKREAATRDAFTDDGWFKTGDIATRSGGIYKILGRSSVDIIKTGGYKVSALEIEEVLRTHEAVDQCGVVGVADEEWGEVVGAAIVLTTSSELTLPALIDWAKERLAPYKVPRRLLVLEDLPRNAMSKVTKPEIVKLFENADR